MVSFKTNGNAGEITLNFPTDLSEINAEFLTNLTENIHVADNYSLIAICYREKLSNVILAANQKKNDMASLVVPIFVKSGISDNDYCKQLRSGTVVIVAASDIAIGHHAISRTNPFTINNLINACAGDTDAYANALKINEYCYFIEFKIIPNASIHGHYSSN